jgi:hypothetical protein
MLRTHILGMTPARPRNPLASAWALVVLAATTTGCPGEEPGTDGTATEAGSTSTGPEPTTMPPTTLPTDDSTTRSSDDATTTVAVDSSDGDSTGSTGSSGSSGGSSDSTGSDSTGTTGDTEGTTTGGVELCEIMLPPPGMCAGPGTDPVGAQFECNPITQADCPAGEKCMPWSNNGGGSWNATRCSPLDAAPVTVGDVCVVDGSGVSGIDNCELGAMCWGVDPMTNQGTCIELCGCSYENPLCDTPNAACAIVNSGVLPLCIPACNPLDPAACPAGQGCYPVGELFQCAPDASGAGGGVGEVCEFINVCEPGNVCIGAAAFPGCGGSGCCSPTCSLDDPAPGCPAGTNCVAWYEMGLEPDACLGTVGVCASI